MMRPMTQDPTARAADPNASHAELYELARTRPDLRPQIAANPSTYPALLQWLGELNDPSIDAALARRGSSDAPTAVQPPVAPPSDFDQQIYGAPAPYASAPPYQAPPSVYDPDDDIPPKRKGGTCVLIALLFLVTTAALVAGYFFLIGSPFADDDSEVDEQPAPAEEIEEEDEAADEGAEDQEPEETAEPEEAPTPTEEDEETDDDSELQSPIPDDALSITEFSSPTGNISCQLSETDVVCTVAEHTFQTPEECDNGVSFRVTEDGQAEIDCSTSVASQSQSLEYGDITGNESFACQAHEMYFECWSQRTGNGFELAREYYALYAG